MSLLIVTKPAGPCSSSIGSASALGTPKPVREGPMARISTCLETLPVTMKPPMPTLSPVSTRIRVERLTVWAGGVGVGVNATVAVAVDVAVMVAVGVDVAVAVAVTVAVAVAVGVNVAVAVAVAVAVVVTVAVAVGV